MSASACGKKSAETKVLLWWVDYPGGLDKYGGEKKIKSINSHCFPVGKN